MCFVSSLANELQSVRAVEIGARERDEQKIHKTEHLQWIIVRGSLTQYQYFISEHHGYRQHCYIATPLVCVCVFVYVCLYIHYVCGRWINV